MNVRVERSTCESAVICLIFYISFLFFRIIFSQSSYFIFPLNLNYLSYFVWWSVFLNNVLGLFYPIHCISQYISRCYFLNFFCPNSWKVGAFELRQRKKKLGHPNFQKSKVGKKTTWMKLSKWNYRKMAKMFGQNSQCILWKERWSYNS